MTKEMNAHQTLIAENKIDISKLPAKLQAKITKFNELDKKKYGTDEDEEELEEQDGVISDKIIEWLDEQDEPESDPKPAPAPEPKKTPKAKKEAEPAEEAEESEEAEEKLATAPTATPKVKEKQAPASPKPKEKVFMPGLGWI